MNDTANLSVDTTALARPAKAKKAAPEPTIVKFADGTEQKFGERQKAVIATDEAEMTLKFYFKHGEMRTFVANPQHATALTAMLHGYKQKFGDAYSGLQDVEDIPAAWDKINQTIENGDWNIERVADEFAGQTLLILALQRLSGKSIDAIKAQIAPMTADEVKALKRVEKVSKAIAELSAERARKKDGDKLAEVEAKFADLLG